MQFQRILPGYLFVLGALVGLFDVPFAVAQIVDEFSIPTVSTPCQMPLFPPPSVPVSVLQELRGARRQYLLGHSQYYSQLATPTQVRVNNRILNVVERLGRGQEGQVLLARYNQRNVTVKEFKSVDLLKSNLERLHAYSSVGVRTPNVIEVDLANKTVIFEYIEGMNVDLIRDPLHIGKRLPISEHTSALVGEAYEVFISKIPEHMRPEAFNVLLDFRSLRFIIIDPNDT